MSDGVIERLSRETRLVVVNRRVAGLSSVVMDVARGARLAIEHLTGLGHRALALLTGPRGAWTNGTLRRAATLAAQAANSSLTVLGPNPPTEAGGAAQAEQVARAGVTGVLAYNDLMAIGLIEGLDALGIRVPEEVSVVGIDDIALSRLTRPKLTTVATPTAQAGQIAVDLLLTPDQRSPVTLRHRARHPRLHRPRPGPRAHHRRQSPPVTSAKAPAGRAARPAPTARARSGLRPRRRAAGRPRPAPPPRRPTR